MGKDPNTPDWVQHLAFEIESMEEQNEVKAKLESDGIDGWSYESYDFQVHLFF